MQPKMTISVDDKGDIKIVSEGDFTAGQLFIVSGVANRMANTVLDQQDFEREMMRSASQKMAPLLRTDKG